MTGEKIWVRAATLADPGLKGKNRCLVEGSRKRYITEAEPMEVEQSAYYYRKLRMGDLVKADPPSEVQKPKSKKTPKFDTSEAKKK